MIHETPFTTASHLTCVGATREDTHRVIKELLAAGWLDARFEGLEDNTEERAKVAADVAAEQIRDLMRRGIHEFHLYTMNRSPLVSAVLEWLGLQRKLDARAGAA